MESPLKNKNSVIQSVLEIFVHAMKGFTNKGESHIPLGSKNRPSSLLCYNSPSNGEGTLEP